MNHRLTSLLQLTPFYPILLHFYSAGNNTEIDLKNVVERIADLTEVQYQQKVVHLKAVRKYFTYAGKLSIHVLLCGCCLLLLLFLSLFFSFHYFFFLT